MGHPTVAFGDILLQLNGDVGHLPRSFLGFPGLTILKTADELAILL